MQRIEPAMLARHVVRGRWDRSKRRTPQHELTITESYEVGQVRVPAGELLDLHRAREVESWQRDAGESITQGGFRPRPVERIS